MEIFKIILALLAALAVVAGLMGGLLFIFAAIQADGGEFAKACREQNGAVTFAFGTKNSQFRCIKGDAVLAWRTL